jgi:hypothetical protein
MVAPIFKFRNVRLRLTSSNATFVYGVVPFDQAIPDKTLAPNTAIDAVSTVVLTVQISNITTPPATVNVSAYVQNSTDTSIFLNAGQIGAARTLVEDYPLVGLNAFDPLSGNLVMAAGDQLWIQASSANSCDVIVSLLEIANATAS